MLSKNIKIGIMVVVAIVVIAGSFYGGMVYKGSQTPARRTFGPGTAGTRFATGGSVSIGSIVSIDGTSITLKMQNGSSRVILYSPTTEVGKFVTGKTSDLQAGENIMVSGQTNSDGSITAQSIQIRPAGQNAPMPGQ